MSAVDARLRSPATARNRDPILSVLARVLPESGTVLEVASGSGEHITYFASRFPGLRFQPSDPEPEARRSIAAWGEALGCPNVLPPLGLCCEPGVPWELGEDELPLAALLNINMIHISPWSACEVLLQRAGELLDDGQPLFLYGPYRRDGRHTAPSNAEFDASLRARNPEWGVRDLEAVSTYAAAQGLQREDIVEMPANNLCVVFRRESRREAP